MVTAHVPGAVAPAGTDQHEYFGADKGRYSNTYPAYVNPWDLIAAARAHQRSTGGPATPARQRRLTESEVDQLVECYAELRSLRLVATELSIDRSTARAHLRARGVALVPPASMTASDVAVAIELYGQGRSSAAIGKTLGFTNKTVIKELRTAGVVIRPPVGRRN